MAVLTTRGDWGDDWAAVRRFPGAVAALAAQVAWLPQPDQLCGPFAGGVALRAVLGEEAPSLLALALASGTAIWPQDEPQWRPAGVPPARTGWEELPVVAAGSHSGTGAAGLARGIAEVTGDEAVAAPAAGPGWTTEGLRRLLGGVRDAPYPVGVVANLRTGPIAPAAAGDWDVGHFVVLWGLHQDGNRVALADSYRELGDGVGPPGCRLVTTDALLRALTAPPGRGLLLLVHRRDRAAAARLVEAAGLSSTLWDA